MVNKAKILVFADWFVPGYKAGGPISSCVNFAFLMKDDYDVYVFTSDTDHGANAPYNLPADQWLNNIDPGFKVYYAKRKEISFHQVKTILKEVQPDFIYLNNMYSLYYVLYPLWLKWTGRIYAKIVLCPRGALYDSALAVKPLKKKLFINGFRWLKMNRIFIFQATNTREKEAVERLFPKSDIKVVDDLPAINQPALKKCLKSPGFLKCVFIARIVAIKNLLFVLEVLTTVKSNVEFTIAGPVEDTEYWEQCQNLIKKMPYNITINYIGSRPTLELLDILQNNHLYILPTLGESFGHTIFEAFSAGRPVLISDQTPWLSLLSKQVGWDLALSDKDAFVQAIETAVNWNQKTFDEWAFKSYSFAKDYVIKSSFKDQYKLLFS